MVMRVILMALATAGAVSAQDADPEQSTPQKIAPFSRKISEIKVVQGELSMDGAYGTRQQIKPLFT